MDIVDSQQLAREGQADYEKGYYRSAADLFKAAADGFNFTGDELSAAEMANNRSVALLQAGEANSALDASIGTELIFERAGDIKRQAMAVGNQAAALERLGRHDEAVHAYEESAHLFANAGEFELRAYVCQSISELQLKQGYYLEAYAVMRAGVMEVKNPNLTQKLLKSLLELPFRFLR